MVSNAKERKTSCNNSNLNLINAGYGKPARRVNQPQPEKTKLPNELSKGKKPQNPDIGSVERVLNSKIEENAQRLGYHNREEWRAIQDVTWKQVEIAYQKEEYWEMTKKLFSYASNLEYQDPALITGDAPCVSLNPTGLFSGAKKLWGTAKAAWNSTAKMKELYKQIMSIPKAERNPSKILELVKKALGVSSKSAASAAKVGAKTTKATNQISATAKNVSEGLKSHGYTVSTVKGALKAVKKEGTYLITKYIHPQSGKIVKVVREGERNQFHKMTMVSTLEKDGTYSHTLVEDAITNRWDDRMKRYYKATDIKTMKYKGLDVDGNPIPGKERSIEISRQLGSNHSENHVINEQQLQKAENFIKSYPGVLPAQDSQAMTFLKLHTSTIFNEKYFVNQIQLDDIRFLIGGW